MLGPAKPRPRRLDEPIAVSLDVLIPSSNFYHHLEAKLALGFVRGWIEDRYADRGPPEGDAEARCLGGVPVRRSEGLAWLAPLPAEEVGEREH